MLLVEIEKPENETLAAWFSDLRNWFDVNRCEPLAFTQAGRRHDRLIYRISFENAAQAQQERGTIIVRGRCGAIGARCRPRRRHSCRSRRWPSPRTSSPRPSLGF